MRTLILLTLLVAGTPVLAQENFYSVLGKIQDSNWAGRFDFKALGIRCDGDLKVKFFPAQIEDFSDGASTVSYRHDADFSQNKNIFCRKIGKHLSVVDVGQCPNFPMKYNPSEGQNVPFRTIIPRQGGKVAYVSSPSCHSSGTVSRQELQLIKADLSEDGNDLGLTIRLEIKRNLLAPLLFLIPVPNLPLQIPLSFVVDLNYQMHKVP